MLKMLNRMCWNTRGWLLPTGTAPDKGYPSEYGFGHEEWNFQLDDAIDGYVYGYLYHRPSAQKLKEADGHFHILFWSQHPGVKQDLIFGAYEDATLTTQEDIERLNEVFKKEKIYERRAKELYEVISDRMTYQQVYDEIVNTVRSGQLSYKCPIESVVVFPTNHQIKDVFPGKSYGFRFSRATYVKTDGLINLKLNTVQTKPSSTLAEDAYYRETKAKLKVIIPKHNHLSNNFCEWLREQGIKYEQEKNYVDVAFSKQGTSYLAELKVCYGTGTSRSIREALGQLLEYNFYRNRLRSDRWIIVLDEKPSEYDIEYIHTLRRILNFPLSLIYRTDAKKFILVAGDTI